MQFSLPGMLAQRFVSYSFDCVFAILSPHLMRRHHRRRSCASPVLTAIGLVNGKPWELVIFDPPPTKSTYLNRSLKICHRWLAPWPLQLCKIWWKSVHEGFWANRWNIAKKNLFIPLFKQVTYRTVHHIFTLNGSNDADSRKSVPFLAFVDVAPYFGDQIAQKTQFLGRE